MERFLWLTVLGVVRGALGTLIGAGGGFVLVPVLLLLYPQADPETITSISLAVVFFNALSGSWPMRGWGVSTTDLDCSLRPPPCQGRFSYDLRLGMWLSLGVGYVSSLLGIGGGIVHVPILVRLLSFPVHIATATSHFILAIMALTGTIVHIASGSFAHGSVRRTICLGIGVLLGAQVGAALSARVHGMWIIRGLAVAFACVGIRILMMAL